MYNVHSTWNWQFRCIYVYIRKHATTAIPARRLGTQRSPFTNPCWVFLSTCDHEQEQDRVLVSLGPMVPCKYCIIFTHNQPVASFYPSNPKSQSRHLLSLCIVLLVLAYFYAF